MQNHLLPKFFFIMIFCAFVGGGLFASPVLKTPEKIDLPSNKAFLQNTQYIRPFKEKKLTVVEYITDPLILYASLWGCIGLSLPLWDDVRASGFNVLFDINPEGESFLDRLKMEPFASGRIDPVTTTIEINGGVHTVLRGEIYAKNIVEPIYFTYLALYLRAKNYHPAIMITEIILLSVLYELTVRPFFMTSSFEQLLKNPAISIVCAIFLDELSTFLLSTPHKGLHVLAYILNPFNSLPNSRIHPMLFFDPYKHAASLEAIIQF